MMPILVKPISILALCVAVGCGPVQQVSVDPAPDAPEGESPIAGRSEPSLSSGIERQRIFCADRMGYLSAFNSYASATEPGTVLFWKNAGTSEMRSSSPLALRSDGYETSLLFQNSAYAASGYQTLYLGTVNLFYYRHHAEAIAMVPRPAPAAASEARRAGVELRGFGADQLGNLLALPFHLKEAPSLPGYLIRESSSDGAPLATWDVSPRTHFNVRVDGAARLALLDEWVSEAQAFRPKLLVLDNGFGIEESIGLDRPERGVLAVSPRFLGSPGVSSGAEVIWMRIEQGSPAFRVFHLETGSVSAPSLPADTVLENPHPGYALLRAADGTDLVGLADENGVHLFGLSADRTRLERVKKIEYPVALLQLKEEASRRVGRSSGRRSAQRYVVALEAPARSRDSLFITLYQIGGPSLFRVTPDGEFIRVSAARCEQLSLVEESFRLRHPMPEPPPREPDDEELFPGGDIR